MNEDWSDEKKRITKEVIKDARVLMHDAKEWKGDKDVVLAALNNDARALGNASEELKGDKDFVLAAVAKNADTLLYATGEMKNDKELVLAAVKKDADTLRYASEELKGDKDVVLAAVTQNADTLRYATGEMKNDKDVLAAAADALRHKERGQKVYGDTDRGEDQLGLKTITEALAETLVFKDLQPPFVLGILGKWGKGKSYFFNLMLDRIIQIQKQEANDDHKELFSGHVYTVTFNAWAFSKGNIWSSLMYQILKELNQQLQFEEKMREENRENIMSTLEVFRNCSAQEVEYIEENPGVFKKYQKIMEDSDSPHESLLKAINANYDEDKDELKKVIRRKQVVNVKKKFEQFVRKEILHKIEEKFEAEIKKMDNAESIDKAYKEMIDNIQNVKWYQYKFQVSKISHIAIMCFALFINFAIYLIFNNQEIVGYVTFVSGFLFPIIPYFTSISSAMKHIDPFVEKFEEQEGKCDDNWKKLKDEEEKIKNRTLLLEGSSLHDVTAHINSSDYENNLGTVHRVQKDLQQMSDAMLNKKQQDLFPRGDPRIILFVDDLDRCPPNTVVEVIEALQLLVKTKLFVAVLAIDPRYVTSSLEKYYKGVLDPQVPPTGMDFLEKIIQVPFHLPAAEEDYIDAFIDSQIDEEEPEVEAELIATDQEDLSSATAIAKKKQEGEPDPSNNQGEFSSPKDERLPSNQITFTKKEGKMIRKIFKIFKPAPRCMRRIINVLKLLWVIWKRDSRFEGDENLKRATLFLLLLAADESTRDTTYKIFEWMELGMVAYDNVADNGEDETKKMNNLADLFKREMIKKKNNNFKIAEKGNFMQIVEEYLKDYKLNTFEDWKTTSSKFLLARSFSFFRLVTNEIDSDEE